VLSLTADSTLNLVADGNSSTVTFNGASGSGGMLTINNWVGTTDPNGNGLIGSDDKIIINGTVDPSFLNHVQFSFGTDLYYGAMNGNELVRGITLVPEPIHYALGLFGLVFVCLRTGKYYLTRRESAAGADALQNLTEV
jgi:hypothetical protein